MKVLVYPHVLELGGSQLNAVELAGAVRDLGHDVVVFGQPGPLQRRIDELGLEFIAAPPPGRRPSPAVMAALSRVVRSRGIDLVHGYEWTAGLEAYLAGVIRCDRPVVCTVMSMAVAPFLPRTLPLVVGTEQIRAHERSIGRRPVEVIEPPVDVRFNSPESPGDLAGFRRDFALDEGTLTVVCVSRLAAELKLEGLLTAIDVIGLLAQDRAVRLVIVGDGPARGLVEERAAAVNARTGRRTVVVVGELSDPRPAYAAADVCLGMGGSALRSMAFAKPLVVQGEKGFWRQLTPESFPGFAWTGWYGVATSSDQGPALLREALIPLLADGDLRARLGAYARQVVVERFSLTGAGRRQLDIYERAVAASPGRWEWPVPASAGAGRFLAYKVRQRVQRWSGTARADDFNSRPVAAVPGAPGPSPVSRQGELP